MQEAVEVMGTLIRWTEQPKNAEDKSIYVGPVIQGFYKDKKVNIGQNDSNLYEILLSNGTLVSVWGSGLLDGKFAEIPMGCEVRLTYLGITQPKTAKGRAYQNFKVEYDKSSRIPMNVAAPSATGQTPVAPTYAAPAYQAPVAPTAAPAYVAPQTAAPVAPVAALGVAPVVPPQQAPAQGDGF